MRTIIKNINGNPNIGIYCFARNNYAIIGKGVRDKDEKEIGKVLGVKTIKTSIANTSLAGVFLNGDEEKLMVPSIITDTEYSFLDKELTKIGVTLKIFETSLTALNNNILVGKNNVIISPEYNERESKKIAVILGKRVIRKGLGKTHVPGSLVVINMEKAAISEALSEKEEKLIEKMFEVETNRITVNMGNPFISAGIIVNKNGLIIGSMSGGAEMAMIEQALRR